MFPADKTTPHQLRKRKRELREAQQTYRERRAVWASLPSRRNRWGDELSPDRKAAFDLAANARFWIFDAKTALDYALRVKAEIESGVRDFLGRDR